VLLRMTRFVTSAHTANKFTSASLFATICSLSLFVLSALGKIEVIVICISAMQL